MHLSRYMIEALDPTDFESVLLFSTRGGGEVIRLPQDTLSKMRAGLFESLSEEIVEKLRTNRILVDESPSEEFAIVLRENDQVVRSIDTLTVTYMPSASCPHGCWKPTMGGYCGQQHSSIHASETTEAELVEHVRSRLQNYKYSLVHLKIFGGEPLTRPESVASMMDRISIIARSASVLLTISMVTSGFLFHIRIARRLLVLGLDEVEVTLDGLAEQHDRRRGTLGGGSTFVRTYRNLMDVGHAEDLKSLRINIRMNADSRNYADVLPLMDTLERDGLLPRCRFYLAPVRDWGGNRAGSQYLNRLEFARWEMKVIARQVERNFAGAPLLPPRRFVTCPALDEHSTIFAPDGQRHQCSETPLTSINEFLPAELPQSSSWKDSWADRLKATEQPCNSCNLLPLCGGACPKDWLLGIVPCPSFKDNIRERIALSALAGSHLGPDVDGCR